MGLIQLVKDHKNKIQGFLGEKFRLKIAILNSALVFSPQSCPVSFRHANPDKHMRQFLKKINLLMYVCILHLHLNVYLLLVLFSGEPLLIKKQ